MKNLQLNKLRELVINGQTRPEQWRRLQLSRIDDLLEQEEDSILNALKQDLEKPKSEAIFELIALRQELRIAKQHLSNWMQPQKIPVPIPLKPGTAMVRLEPLGCILIIGPWNYPFSLTLQPLISALAAGNTAVLKPSEHAPATSNLIEELINKYFPENIVQVFQGDEKTGSSLISKPFDHIFFTGGSAVGKKVMSAAAENLTPVTLELGGKSPAIVIDGADLEITARRLIWGKSLNSGQTCIAPDYILVEEKLKGRLIRAMKTEITKFYGETPLKSKHLAKIINNKQLSRLTNLLENSLKKDQVIFGGEVSRKDQRISPTLIEVKDYEDELMREELFGPLVPIMGISSLKSAIVELQKKEYPLAMYLFGGTNKDRRTLLNQTNSGSVCFNDVVLQAGIPQLPFGGVGASGMGKYHGQSGFQNFSNQRSILSRPFWLDLNFRYPPYTLDISILKRLLG